MGDYLPELQAAANVFRSRGRGAGFGAAPSVALASLAFAAAKKGNEHAAVEARSMVIGAVAFLVYAYGVSWIMMRYKPSAIRVTLTMLPVWLGISLGVWFVWLR